MATVNERSRDEDEPLRRFRPRRLMLLPAVAAICVVGFTIWRWFMPLDAIRHACEVQGSACPSVEAQVFVYDRGRIVLELREEDCDERSYVSFSSAPNRNGVYVGFGQSVEKPDDSENVRGTAPCSELESLRWTWIGPRLRDWFD
jgi:hypothetical protein